MGEQDSKEIIEHICVGLLAHVDAGKTTLSEGLLYSGGKIREKGRVDNQDAYLDTFALERARGITIFSKQAVFKRGGREYTLLDTPGHVDFSPEMERTIQVLDYAILVISAADGVQGHTQTLWRLLNRYQMPVFLFVNKMDQAGADKDQVLAELKKRLDENCIDFTPGQDADTFQENLAMCDEALMEQYLEEGSVNEQEIVDLIQKRKAFPCYFGSALKQEGVEDLLCGLDQYAKSQKYPQGFAAKVFKIARDGQENRLTFLKITGGKLKVKDILKGKVKGRTKEQEWEEKIDQIRIYSGAKYETAQEAEAGTVCAVTGLTNTFPGQGLGAESDTASPILEPVLNYRIRFPEGCNIHDMLLKLRRLEEEEPMLRVFWDEQLGEIHVRLMGKVQEEILKSQIADRFGVQAELDAGGIVYKETIESMVEGVGHYEPLRHYAEVHLRLEPGESGSGLQFFTECSEDKLDGHWQRLILTHLAEKQHVGVLTGAPVTDMKLTLTAGRAHLKHTEGGDFRQATYRAVRHGLKKAKSILLEPYYEFVLEVPQEVAGRAMTDIQRMNGSFQPPETDGETAILTGSAPVVRMGDYQTEVASYTKGAGRLFCTLKGYAPCHNAYEVIKAVGYDSERDLDNPTGSVFCVHGAGVAVSWEQVEEYMHLECTLETEEEEEEQETNRSEKSKKAGPDSYEKYRAEENELKAIFERTYGPVKKRLTSLGEEDNGAGDWKKKQQMTERGNPPKKKNDSERKNSSGRISESGRQEEYLLVDGYNVIFDWEDLRELAEINIDGARTKLMDILSNYQGYKKCTLILVFDAYQVTGFQGEVDRYHNIYVVYTKEAETADQYIEKTVHKIGRNHQVAVATSDHLEQVIILGAGARRISSGEFREEVEAVRQQIREEYQARRQAHSGRNYLFQALDEETANYMEDIRLGRKEE